MRKQLISLGFGIVIAFLFFMAFGALITKAYISACLSTITALLLMPKIRNFIYEKINIPLKYTVTLMTFLFFLSVVIMPIIELKAISEAEKKQKEIELAKQEQLRKQREAELVVKKARITQYFQANKEQIITDIKNYIQNKKIGEAIVLANKYLLSEDNDLKNLYHEAKEIQKETHKKIEIEKILSKLTTISENNYRERFSLYSKLVKLVPGNREYNQKVKYYAEKVTQQNKEQKERHAKFGNPPILFSGSYIEVENYLYKTAHDPNSIEIVGCSDVNYSDDGWIVSCDYRGKNMFGALILKTNMFIIRHNQVVGVR